MRKRTLESKPLPPTSAKKTKTIPQCLLQKSSLYRLENEIQIHPFLLLLLELIWVWIQCWALIKI